MRNKKQLLAGFMSGLIIWSTVFSPFVAYAQLNLENHENSAINQDGLVGETGSSVDDPSSQLNSDFPSISYDDDLQFESKGDFSESGEDLVIESASESQSVDTADHETQSVHIDNAANGYLENSWRYENGALRSGVELSTHSSGIRSVRPEGATGWGIDVSSHQGVINWKKVKSAGVEFAILRCGYGDGIIDSRFIDNVRGCKEYGIPFGVYLYCYAWDERSAREEAEGTLRILAQAGVKPSDLLFPVYYDIENVVGNNSHPDYGKPAGVDGNNQYHVIRDNSTFAIMARTYCEVLNRAGYETGVYASLSWWRSYLNDPIFERWDRWVAQYYDQCTYEGIYAMWQYSSQGVVDGIAGNVDVNWTYDDRLSPPDLSGSVIDLTLNMNGVDAVASGIPASISNVAFEVRSGFGASRWYQAYRQEDGSWVSTIDAVSDFSCWGEFTFTAYCNKGSQTYLVSSRRINIGRPDVSIELEKEGGVASLLSSCWMPNPSNVAFEVISPLGTSIWFQGYFSKAGTWSSREAADYIIGVGKPCKVSVWANYSSSPELFERATIEAAWKDPSIQASSRGTTLSMSAAGWQYSPSNVAFAVTSPTGSTVWLQGNLLDDGSWVADVNALATFSEWGYYKIVCWATFGGSTKAYGKTSSIVSPGSLQLDTSTDNGILGAVVSGWTIEPQNVAFEVRTPNGLTQWFQAYMDHDGAWYSHFDGLSETGKYQVVAWATVEGITTRCATASAWTEIGDPSLSCDVKGYNVKLSSSGWALSPSNVAFAVLLPSGDTKWIQGYRNTDGSWGASISVPKDLNTWGRFKVTCWASHGSTAVPYESVSFVASPGNVDVVATVSESGIFFASVAGWAFEPENVAFKVSLDSGKVCWIQAYKESGHSWVSNFSISDLGEWGNYNIEAYATFDGFTQSYGASAASIDIGSIDSRVEISGDRFRVISTGWKVAPRNVAFRIIKPGGGDAWLQGIQSVDGSWFVESAASNGFSRYGSYSVQVYAEICNLVAVASSTSFIFPPYIGYQNPWQYYQVSNVSVPIKNLGNGKFGYRTESRIPYNATRNDCVNAMVTRAMDYLGTPYIWNYACSPGIGVDCAGLVLQSLYATGMNLDPMNPWDHFYDKLHDQYANYMWEHGKFQKLPFSQRQVGDLISTPGHISIYIGNDRIIEAWPRAGVRITSVYSSLNIRGILRPYV